MKRLFFLLIFGLFLMQATPAFSADFDNDVGIMYVMPSNYVQAVEADALTMNTTYIISSQGIYRTFVEAYMAETYLENTRCIDRHTQEVVYDTKLFSIVNNFELNLMYRPLNYKRAIHFGSINKLI